MVLGTILMIFLISLLVRKMSSCSLGPDLSDRKHECFVSIVADRSSGVDCELLQLCAGLLLSL